ncbi:hypothetical protein [Paraburkholderia sp. BCC1884]|uniref:hypothetical protein n=1 Tax=Paraburkholderia sp. BCC1884 TaxID=2562668 RepID=UPI001182425D|nr:hypothetical protein [Paraburkholderia sp. BCC1884]
MKKEKVNGLVNKQTRDERAKGGDLAERLVSGVGLFVLGMVAGASLTGHNRRAARVSASVEPSIAIPLPPSTSDTSRELDPLDAKKSRKKFQSKEFWTHLLRHLSLDHKDPLAHFTKTLFGSIGIVFILEALGHWRPTSEAARTSLPLLIDHVHEIPSSIVNISLAFAGMAASAKAFKFLDKLTTHVITPLSEFTLHLFVIGIGASVGEQIIYACTHLLTAPLRAEPAVSLLWLCGNALVLAITMRYVINAPERLLPTRISGRLAYFAVGAIVSAVFVVYAPFPSSDAWNSLFATKLPELKLKTANKV